MKEHSIIYREPGACWSSSTTQLQRRKREVNSGHVYNLWPFTNITAQIRVLNAKYEGPPSASIAFMTAEGGKLITWLRHKLVSDEWRTYWPVEVNECVMSCTSRPGHVSAQSISHSRGIFKDFEHGSVKQPLGVPSFPFYRFWLQKRFKFEN